jgi:hypothetical protein
MRGSLCDISEEVSGGGAPLGAGPQWVSEEAKRGGAPVSVLGVMVWRRVNLGSSEEQPLLALGVQSI